MNERQEKWVCKVQSFDFDIEYVKGKNNVVVDALSQKPTICLLEQISTALKPQLLVEYSKNTFTYELMDGHIHNFLYRVMDFIIYYKDQIYLVLESKLKQKILKEVHDYLLARHPSFLKTYKNMQEIFSCKGLKGEVLKHVRECTILQ